MSNLPKFNIRESGRELPYYKKIVRLKNGKYIEVENPLFSGLKSQLPDIYIAIKNFGILVIKYIPI